MFSLQNISSTGSVGLWDCMSVCKRRDALIWDTQYSHDISSEQPIWPASIPISPLGPHHHQMGGHPAEAQSTAVPVPADVTQLPWDPPSHPQGLQARTMLGLSDRQDYQSGKQPSRVSTR